MRIRNLTKENVVCEAEEARGFFARARGLMLARELKEGKGLLLRFVLGSSSIHSLFMRFPLDLVFLDSSKRVVDLHTLKLWRIYRPKRYCAWVLEVNEGVIKEKGIEIGDVLVFES